MRAPRGFVLSGARAGLRKKRGLDVAMIVVEGGAEAAAVFTRNRFQAAPVVLSRRALQKSNGRVTAVVVNAGCANAITGKEGMAAAKRVGKRAAELLSCPEEEIFLASTGVIGVVLPDVKIRSVLAHAVTSLSALGLDAASQAILTTDVGPKVAQATFTVNGKKGRIAGFAKGAGMIHPNMATMLAFVLTDVAATPAYLKAALTKAAGTSFNAISVDGDTSTNDTVLVMASGKLGNERLSAAGDGADFQRALGEVCGALARMIVRDGEGATRLMCLEVVGAKTEREAKLAAHAVATSPLVKTALAGGDPNWGRILAAVGRSGARLSTGKVSLTVGSLTLVKDGQPVAYEEADAARIFAREEVPVVVDLGVGKASASILTCDLGHGYVSVNADYRS